MKALPRLGQMTVARAKEILAEHGLQFVKSEVRVWRYDWNSTHRQGDSGIAKERLYYFKGDEQIAFNTRCLKNRAQALLWSKHFEGVR